MIKKLRVYIYVSLILFLGSLNLGQSVNSLDTFEYRKEKIVENNIQKNIRSEYILGPGDSLFIKFQGISIFSGIYNVDPEGNIDLPEINKFTVSGLTANELTQSLIREYKNFIIEPDINISLASYRPVTIYIAGEIKSPGLYTLQYRGGDFNNMPSVNNNYQVSLNDSISKQQKLVTKSPKLFQALQTANGVKNTADLENIKIIRKNSNSQGGGEIETSINLLDLIINGNQTQNIVLRDGDNIFIPKSKNIIKEQIISINNTNLNPSSHFVFVTGNVVNPGRLEVKKGTSLIQALASSGGKKIMTGKIEFIRFGPEGLTKKNTFTYNSKAKIDTDKNPILMEGDIINVRRTILGSTSEVVQEFASPIFGVAGLISIFE